MLRRFPSAAAFIHILHFMVLFMIIHITFSVIGYLNFGPQNRDFATFLNSMMVLGEGVLSGHFDVGPQFGNGMIAYGKHFLYEEHAVACLMCCGFLCILVR